MNETQAPTKLQTGARINAAAPDFEDSLRLIGSVLDDRKGEDIVILDVRGLSSVTDAIVLCSGFSDKHVQAMAEHVLTAMKRAGRLPLNREGLQGGAWALLDFDDIVVHIFYDPIRRHYDLEGIWHDAPRIVRPESEPQGEG
ncbi:MAG: ribosome silencing factor [Deltaproteobacteria bacterium]|nr:ribosome silencing factor [Candidatus Anaeroferrophillacea bacterium]